jgi:hypothetical protein
VPARLDPVDEPALVGVVERLTGELARAGLERAHLRGKPRIVLELGGQRRRVLPERGRLMRLLRLDAARELGRPVVRVDEIVRVSSEPEAELQVALDVISHARRAGACRRRLKAVAASPARPS